MFKTWSGETLVKFAIVISFFVGYGWIYHTMVKDEQSFKRLYAEHFQTIEKISTGYHHE